MKALQEELKIIETREEEDVNALQEELKYIHIFFDKFFECAGKVDIKITHVETEEEEDLHLCSSTIEKQ